MRSSEEVVTGGLGAGSATRPMDSMRKKPKVTDLIRDGVGYLTDQSGNHQVRMDWELNDMAVRDKIFKITIDDDTEIYVDLEELLFYTRIMFMKG